MDIIIGAVGTVCLPGQLLSGVQKLVEFWDSVKDAPAEVADIKLHLRLLGSLLDNIESQASEENSILPSVAAECLTSVRSSIVKLEKLSQELDTGLNAKGVRRQWTKLKKAMREKELEKYTGELLNAKITLNIYQTLQNANHQISNGAITTDINRNLQLLLASGRITKPQDQELEIARIPRNYRFRKINISISTYEVSLSFGKIRF